MTLAEQYIDEVLTSKIVVSDYILKAIQKHKDLLKNSPENGYYFDYDSAQEAVELVKNFKHTKGDAYGQFFQMLPWQAFIIYYIFGWKLVKNDKRLVRKAYIEVAKKNGKTELAAAVALLMTFFDNENGAETYITAKVKGQAEICYDSICKMLKQMYSYSPSAKADLKYNTRVALSKSTDSKIKPLSKDSDGAEGINVHCAINDEVHTHAKGSQINNVESAMVARSQPLSFNITTAGTSIASYCYMLRTTCIQVLNGVKHDDTLLALIYGLDEKDDWEDKKNWPKANPSLGIHGGVSIESLEIEYNKAINEGASKIDYFKTRHLSVWVSSVSTWIPDREFKLCMNRTLEYTDYEGKKCWAGLDLSSVFDLSALSIVIPPKKKKGKYKYFVKLYLPKENIEKLESDHKAPYRQWAKEGWITLTPGNSIDYNYIYKDILQVSKYLNIKTLGYDRKFSTAIVQKLENAGISTRPVTQSTTVMNAPIQEFEIAVRKNRLEYDNPILRWMMSECALYTDSDNCKKVDRRNSGKVDGLVASLMGLLQYIASITDVEKEKAYEDEGLFFI